MKGKRVKQKVKKKKESAAEYGGSEEWSRGREKRY